MLTLKIERFDRELTKTSLAVIDSEDHVSMVTNDGTAILLNSTAVGELREWLGEWLSTNKESADE